MRTHIPSPNPPTQVRGLHLRRAALATLLAAQQPMSIGDIAAQIARASGASVDGKALADCLGYEMTKGRARHVRRGVYAVVPSALPSTTRWRIVHWRRWWVTSWY
jgi:hypothetical protein